MADAGAVLILQGGEPTEVLLHDGSGTSAVALEPLRSFRHGSADGVLVADLAPVGAASLEVDGARFPLDAGDRVVELGKTGDTWARGTVASDPVGLQPRTDDVWQVPLFGWLGWLLVALAITLAARKVAR